jgi:DNA topoisomerase-1
MPAPAEARRLRLVIVESPKKAKTIAAILGREYRVEASFGHVRDLPPRRLGVAIDEGFTPEWVPVPKARTRLAVLKNAAAGAEAVLLATDPDREGEAIAWHVAQALKLRSPTRVVFHAITPSAVRTAFEHPRPLDNRLVDAQHARRVLDRLVGYQVSPLLWRKIARGTSAGRVQSVALRLVVEREREIRGFVPREYWTIDAVLRPDGREPFLARLVEIDGKKAELADRAAGDAAIKDLADARYRVASQAEKTIQRTAPPPFTTSTLQQAAAARLRLPGKKTMVLAQSLYEAGLITYHRTDAVRVEPEAVATARAVIEARFGREYLPDKPRQFANRVKNAQEAHEAVRPVDARRAPEELGRLAADELALYRLIWQRFVASQMAGARYDRRTVDVAAEGRHRYALRAGATALSFPGYLAVYGVESADERPPEAEADEAEAANERLPVLRGGELLALIELRPAQHFTQPPPRFTESALIRELERAGVGRPSTYATIVGTIGERGYVERDGKHFVPTELGFAVNDFVVSFFPSVADLGFTADLEDGLDAVARGECGWQELLQGFYGPFRGALDVAGRAMARSVAPTAAPKRRRGRRPPDPLTRRVKPRGVKSAESANPTGEMCPLCGRPMVLRKGPYGEFLGCSGFPACRGTVKLEEPVPRGTSRSRPRSRGRSRP